MIYLNVPFEQKNEAKSLGARWDNVARKWYVPDNKKDQIDLFRLWLPKQENSQAVLSSDSFIQKFEADLNTKSVENSRNGGMHLSQYLSLIQQTIQHTYHKGQWVRAEITNFQKRRGHLYLDLSENADNGKTLASCRAMIWANQAMALEKKFAEVTRQHLGDGQKVLVFVIPSFHQQFGFSLQINDIDPNYTLGDIEKNLNEIRNRLKNEGLYSKNSKTWLPIDFFSIAVIAPPNAAGLGDFKSEADRLEQHKICKFDYFNAAFQGDKTQPEILSAINKIMTKIKEYQMVVVIRGGGAKLDLHYLNNYEIAAKLSQLPIPVMTGIGHERDSTILDEIAHTKMDTPSKVVSFIERAILKTARETKLNWEYICNFIQQIKEKQKQQIEFLHQQLIRQSYDLLRWQKQWYLQFEQKFEPSVKYQLSQNKTMVEQSIQSIKFTAQTICHTNKLNNEQSFQNMKRSLENIHQHKKHTLENLIQQLIPSVKATLKETQVYQEKLRDSFIQIVDTKTKNETIALNQKIDQAKKQSSLLIKDQKKHIEQQIRYVMSAGAKTQMQRGFAVIKQNNKPLMSIQAINKEQDIEIFMHDGLARAEVKKIKVNEENKDE